MASTISPSHFGTTFHTWTFAWSNTSDRLIFLSRIIPTLEFLEVTSTSWKAESLPANLWDQKKERAVGHDFQTRTIHLCLKTRLVEILVRKSKYSAVLSKNVERKFEFCQVSFWKQIICEENYDFLEIFELHRSNYERNPLKYRRRNRLHFAIQIHYLWLILKTTYMLLVTLSRKVILRKS